jgi:hypothetical protein
MARKSQDFKDLMKQKQDKDMIRTSNSHFEKNKVLAPILEFKI